MARVLPPRSVLAMSDLVWFCDRLLARCRFAPSEAEGADNQVSGAVKIREESRIGIGLNLVEENGNRSVEMALDIRRLLRVYLHLGLEQFSHRPQAIHGRPQTREAPLKHTNLPPFSAVNAPR